MSSACLAALFRSRHAEPANGALWMQSCSGYPIGRSLPVHRSLPSTRRTKETACCHARSKSPATEASRTPQRTTPHDQPATAAEKHRTIRREPSSHRVRRRNAASDPGLFFYRPLLGRRGHYLRRLFNANRQSLERSSEVKLAVTQRNTTEHQ